MMSTIRIPFGNVTLPLANGHADLKYGMDAQKLPCIEILWFLDDGKCGGTFIPIRVLAGESLDNAVARKLSGKFPSGMPQEVREVITKWAKAF